MWQYFVGMEELERMGDMPACDKFYISWCHETTSDFNVLIRDSGSGVTLNFKALLFVE